MSGLNRICLSELNSNTCRIALARAAASLLLSLCVLLPTFAQQRRERESNSVYSQRRQKLASQIDAPIVLLGYTGKEEEAQTYIFTQEENFYYLTGHNEEEAALIILPPGIARRKKTTGRVRANSCSFRRKM